MLFLFKLYYFLAENYNYFLPKMFSFYFYNNKNPLILLKRYSFCHLCLQEAFMTNINFLITLLGTFNLLWSKTYLMYMYINGPNVSNFKTFVNQTSILKSTIRLLFCVVLPHKDWNKVSPLLCSFYGCKSPLKSWWKMKVSRRCSTAPLNPGHVSQQGCVQGERPPSQ